MKRDLKIKTETAKGVKTITLPQIKMGETMFCGQGAKKAVIMKPKKLTKKEEKEALGCIRKIVTSIADSIEKNEKEFIDGMAKLMVEQGVLMDGARKKGIDPASLMDKIKEKYMIIRKK